MHETDWTESWVPARNAIRQINFYGFQNCGENDYTMVELLPLSILAPFIKDIDPRSNQAIVTVPDGIRQRLSDSHFTRNCFPDSRPPEGNLRVIWTTLGDVDTAITDEELVEREFKGTKWQQQVQRALRDEGLIQDRSTWVDEQSSIIKVGNVQDDLFSVKVDNLPDNIWNGELAEHLRSLHCDYFTKINVPIDQREMEATGIERPRRFGFVKFERLRWALKFCEDFPKMKMGNFILNVALSI
jgi:hypothetical protein